MTTPISRGPYAKGIAKREEILRTALEVFAATGAKGSSLRGLAEAAGLSQAGLLHYFGSKEELFVEVLRARDQGDVETFQDEDVVRTLVRVIRHNLDVPGLVELFARLSVAAADPAHPGHAFFVERYAAFRALFAQYVRGMQEQGELDPGLDPEGVATLILAAADGLQTQWMLDPSIDMAARVAELWTIITASRPSMNAPTRADAHD